MRNTGRLSKRDRLLCVVLLVLLSASVVAAGGLTVSAQTSTPPQLEVKPAEFITYKLTTFNVVIWLNNIDASQRLIGLQFWLHYNATILDVLNVTEGSFLSQFKNAQAEPYTFSTQIVEDETIKVEILIMPNSTQQGGEWTVFPQGNGTLATIAFQGVYKGLYPQQDSCPLALTNIVLLNDSLGEIPTAPPINGFYQILPQNPSTISLIVNPTTTEFGSPVTISGAIQPSKESADVSIYKRLEPDVWMPLATAKTNATGGYKFDWTPEEVGTFEIKANWTGDDLTLPAESSSTLLTIALTHSEITLSADPQVTVFGSIINVTGNITPARENVNVTIYKRFETGTWTKLVVVRSNASSAYSYDWVPESPGAFQLKANWTGDIKTLPAESGIISLTVNKSASEISLSVNPQVVTYGSSVTLSGVILPSKEGVDVSIYGRFESGLWTQLIAVKTNPAGEYTYGWTPGNTGNLEVKANWTGDPTTLPSETAVVLFVVRKIASEINLDVNPQTITLGSNVTLTGSISPRRAGVIVTISYRMSEGQWSDLLNIKTDSNGQYGYSWNPSKAGTFEIKANWQGDDNTLSAESVSQSVNVQAPSDMFLYAVIVAVLIIAAALITVMLFYRRTRRSKQTD